MAERDGQVQVDDDPVATPVDLINRGDRGRTANDVSSRQARSRMRVSDLLRVGTVGMRTRRLRTVLTATGIAIGIAALVAVLGISASSRADLIAKLDALGTNHLEVAAGASFTPGATAALDDSAIAMARRVGAVESASGITTVTATVRRSDIVDSEVTSGVSVQATDPYFLSATGGSLQAGAFLNAATERYPTIVLGATAAQRLGISSTSPNQRLYVSGHWFSLAGIMKAIPLFPNLDSSAFIGYPIAANLFATAVAPSTVFVVASPDQVDAVYNVLPATTDPQNPGEATVTRPSDAIAAKNAANSTLNALLLGLGGVALLVGGIGIANVMVISVLERRVEIGVRRALGATKRHVRAQFLIEAVMLAVLGGLIGVGLGIAITAGYARVRHIVFSVPLSSVGIGFGAAILVGAIAGISPASRAARLAPADAVRPL